MDRQLIRKALKDIDEVIKEIAKKENYALIFEKNSAGIAHLKEGIDISEKVIMV